MKILVVCLGNICRSPIGEALLQKHAREAGLDWVVKSVGTNRFHKGGPADSRSIAACSKRGVDIRPHIARRLRSSDFDEYDVLLSMAEDVTEEMQEFVRGPNDSKKIVPFLASLNLASNSEKVPDVPDPWYGGPEGFDSCYELIDQACRAWVKRGSIS